MSKPPRFSSKPARAGQSTARLRVELLGIWRRCAAADAGRRQAATVSPYGVTKLSAEQLCHLYHVNYGVPAVSMRISRCTGRASGRIWAFTGSSSRRCRQAGHGLRRRTADPRFHLRERCRGRDHRRKYAGNTRGCLQYWRWLAGRAAGRLRAIGRITGRPLRLNMIEPQAGDMRDTYADTARAREDLRSRRR